MNYYSALDIEPDGSPSGSLPGPTNVNPSRRRARLPMRLFVSSKLNVLAEELNTPCRKRNCIDGLMNNTNFQQWYLLSVDVPECMPWFDDLLSVMIESLTQTTVLFYCNYLH